jgi:tetratricopeptide (TPR) repeat protein
MNTTRVSELSEEIRRLEKVLGSASGAEVTGLRYPLARAYEERYEHLEAKEDLETAISLFRRVLEDLELNALQRATATNDLGNVLRLRYDRTLSIADLEEAIACFRDAADRWPDPGFRMNLGNGLRDRYRLSPSLSDLDQAIEAYEKAAAASPHDAEQRPLFLHNLACGLRDRSLSDARFRRADLDRAIGLMGEAVEGCPPQSPWLAQFLSNLATALDNRFELTSQLQDLEKAITLHERAVEDAPSGHPQRPSALNNLGNALRNLFVRTQRPEVLDRSVAVLRESVAGTREGAVDLPSRWGNLGNALRDRFALAGETGDLDEAITAYRRAFERIENLELDREPLQNNLANALRTRYRSNGSKEDLNEAIDLYEKALSGTRETAPAFPEREGNLGNALLDRSEAGGAVADQERGLALLLKAASGFDLSPEGALLAARSWAAWALQKGQWKVVLEAHCFALEATERIFRTQTRREDKEVWLRESQGMTADAAYAFGQVGDLRNAVTALERGLTRLLREALAAGDAKPLEEPAPAFEEIRALAHDRPLVYLTATRVGGLALIVRDWEPEVEAVWLPKLDQNELLGRLEEYLRAYVQWQKDSQNSNSRSLWLSALETLSSWAWQVAVEDLFRSLEESPEVHLICSGLLGLIPWHAARDSSADHDPEPAKVFLYAPSARGLAVARQARSHSVHEGLLAVAPGGNLEDDLFGLHLDTLIAASSSPRSLVLEGEAISLSTVLATLPRFRVLHFALHGQVEADAPLKSGLSLGNGERITLSNFLDLRIEEIDLVVLSACESGMSGLVLPDEVISLPTGLLQAGAAGIIASLWAVDDAATVFLMLRFYDLWSAGGHPAGALDTAQRWLRDTTNQEKNDYLKTLRRRDPPWPPDEVWEALSTDLLWRDPARRDFVPTHFWGGFAYFGA